jgi:hypothetical protein
LAVRPIICVDIGVVPHVERAGCATADGDRQDREEADHRIDLAGRHQQADERREDDQRHHTRLEQREIIARIAVGQMRVGQRIMFVGHCHRQRLSLFPRILRGPDMLRSGCKLRPPVGSGGLFLMPAAQALT